MHEFVNNQGLQCLIKIGQLADQHYQNYILRGKRIAVIHPYLSRLISICYRLALGQLMLYVDGMNAVMNQNEVIQWLYSLLEYNVRRLLIVSPMFERRILLSLVWIGCENESETIDRLR